MGERTSRVVSFDCDPECQWRGPSGEKAVVWHGRIAIDLQWVAAAWKDGAVNAHIAVDLFVKNDVATKVVLAGSPISAAITINCPHHDFIVQWIAAKHGLPLLAPPVL